jgi:hydroxymethylglutaryl-CoA lyase
MSVAVPHTADSDHIRVTEIGPRDGLQGEKQAMPTALKRKLVLALDAAGVSEIEVTAFVHPAWIPNLADAEDLIRDVGPLSATRYALVPNARGLARAMASGIEGITTVFSATDGHNRSNLNRTTEESLREVIEVGQLAREAGLQLRASLSTVFGCPYDPTPTVAHILGLAERLQAAGYTRIGLCDTIGVANPRQVGELVRAFRQAFPGLDLDLHFHNTYGRGLANVVAGLDAGATSFDSSIGGLGGCPYAPGATGNISTEDLVAMLHAMGFQTGIDAAALFEATRVVADWRGNEPESQCWRAAHAQRRAA